MKKALVIVIGLLVLVCFSVFGEVTVARSFSLHGEPKYGDNFTSFDYVNSYAPKRGTLRLHSIGTYDNFHSYAQRGVWAAGVDAIYDTLMVGSDDEIDVLYPLVAEKIEYPDDYTWVIFHINPKARFHDGVPITAETVVFTFNTFFEDGVPQFRQIYSTVENVTALDKYRVKFTLKEGDKEMILSLASQPVLPKHFWENKDFTEPLTEPPLGSGPYKIGDYKIGQYVVYERVKDYWGVDLPVNKGQNNFDTIRYDYYRDENVAFEAFKAGEYDFRQENISKNWATMYNGTQFDSGQIRKEEIPHEIPRPMQAFVFNIQRPIFSDRRVREALGYALDFEWMNENLFYDQYTRTRSYFQNTKYEAKGLPGPEELKILEPIRGKIPPEVFTKEYNPPKTDGSGNIRPQIRKALALLKEAGWEIRNRVLANTKTGEPMEFEMLLYSPSFERIAIPIQKNLEKMGVTMNIRLIDTTQFTNRLRERDFDIVSSKYRARYYPDSGLRIIWHSDYLDYTWNTAGVQDPAVDYLVEGIVERQEDEKALLHWGRALDRVLTWNYYVMPEWYTSVFRVAYWDKFARPMTRPKYALGLGTWWAK